MPRSSMHKSHKQSKHNSKDYSDSEEDVKMKDKSSKDDNLTKVPRDPESGDKRKISSHARGGKEVKDPTGHGNGEVPDEYFSSKRRKDKDDSCVGGDRWNGGGDERGNRDKIAEKEISRGERSKMELKSKEFSSKGESLRVDGKSKSKIHDSVGGDIKESSTSLIPEKEDGRSRGESRKKSERDYYSRKEEKELKDKDFRVEKEKETEKILGRDTKRLPLEVKVDIDVGKKPVSQLGDVSEERQSKRSHEHTDYPVQGDSKHSELEKLINKRLRKKGESSSDRGVLHDDFKESEERGLSARSNHKKDVKYKDNKHKDRVYADKYQDDGHKNEEQRDEKNQEETKEDYKRRDDKYGDEREKDSRHRDDRHCADGVKENKTKDEKYREGEKDTNKKDDYYRDATERNDRHREHRYREDNERDGRRRDDRHREDGDKDERRGDERYYDDGDDRRRENKYKEDGDRDNSSKEEKHREDSERGSRNKDSKLGDDIDRDRRMREAKYREEFSTGVYSGDKYISKHLGEDGYAADHNSRKSNAYEDSPSRDDRTVRYRDDQGRRRVDDRDDYADVKSRNAKDQRFDTEKKTGSSSRMDSVSDRGRPASRNAELELSSSHRRRQSPNSNTVAAREHYRLPRQDEYRYRDYGYDDRVRHNTTSKRDYASSLGGSEKTPSRSLEKVGQKEDGRMRESSPERRLTSDIHSSPLKLFEKSPSSSTDRRQFSRSNMRPSIDIEESTQRSGCGYRDMKECSEKEPKEFRELTMDRLPGEDFPHVDVDNTSLSSPLSRNNHFSYSSKSYPHIPPLRTGVDSPLLSGSTEDDNRFKSNFRSRRSGDPNLGRIQGNAWRGVPSWPSPVANGFMPFPHAPPPVGFHSMLQPFPSPVFGIRPSMDMNIPAPYHISDPERFAGPVRPMGWHNQVDDSRPPLHAWDGSNTVFQEENHMYVRPGWDHSRNLPGGRGWDTSGDMWKGLSKNASFEMPSYEEENHFSQTVSEPPSYSIQPSQNDQLGPGQQAVSSDVNQSTYSTEFNVAEDPNINLEEARDKIAELPKKDDVPLCNVYLSRLDISADLTDPELFKKCVGFIDMDPCLVSDLVSSKILLIEETLEAEAASDQILSYSMSTQLDDSLFQRAMSLYNKQKETFNIDVLDGRKNSISSQLIIPKSDLEDLNVEVERTDHLLVASNMHGREGAISNFDSCSTPYCYPECHNEIIHQKPDSPTGNSTNDPVSLIDNAKVLEDLTLTPLSADHIAEETLFTETIEGEKDFHSVATDKVKNNGNIQELAVVGDKLDNLIKSDVCSDASEAMMPESVISGSVNLSRIHDSSSTH